MISLLSVASLIGLARGALVQRKHIFAFYMFAMINVASMRTFTIGLGLSCFANGVPFQRNDFNKTGTEVFVGTPPIRYFLSPDFESIETRIFAADGLRSPFLAPIAHSSSLKAAPEGSEFPFHENITLAGTAVANVGFALSRSPIDEDFGYYGNVDGRLGLGPASAIAKSSVIALRLVEVMSKRVSDIELLDRTPPTPVGVSGAIVPLTSLGKRWMFNAHVVVCGVPTGQRDNEILIDPNTKDFTIPLSVIEAVARAVPGSIADQNRRIWLECDADYRFTTVSDVEFRLPGDVVLRGDASVEDMGDRATSIHPVTGQRFCRTAFTADLKAPHAWRLNPLRLTSAKSVFLSSTERRMVIWTQRVGVPSLAVVARIDVPFVPMFSEVSIVKNGSRTELVSGPVLPQPSGSPRYLVSSLRAEQRGSSLIFHFLRWGIVVSGGRPVEDVAILDINLPGLYRLLSRPELVVRGDKSVALELERVEPSAGFRKYTVVVSRTSIAMTIKLTLA
jgi:hypothetical protein